MSMVSQAIQYVARTKTAVAILYINCYVKPNARQGSGILSVDEDVVELAVSAQAKEGEANKAVVGLLASILKVPKSGVEVVRGMKSRQKTVKIDAQSLSSSVQNGNHREDGVGVGSTMIRKVQALLQKEVDEQ